MKGIIIYENDLRAINAVKLKNASFCCKAIEGDITDTLEGRPVICASANCNKEDTYDFETGALIALMKMYKFDKSYKAIEEAFKYNSYDGKKTNEYEEEIHALKEENKRLKLDCEKYFKTVEDLVVKKNELIEENDKLKKEKEQIIVAKNVLYNRLEKENEKLKKRINELEIYNNQLEDRVAAEQRGGYKFLKDMEKLQHEYDLCKNSENALKITTQMQNKSIEKLTKAIDGYKNDLYKVAKRCRELEAKEDILNKQEETINKREEEMSVYFGGRGCGKQYKALVELFKKLPQDKIDAAYKEAYNTTLPVWQKEALKQMYDIHKESKEKLELPRTLDINGTVYRKSIQIKDFGEQINKLTVDSLIEQSRDITPMRWDLFKKGRIVVGVKNNYELEEFRKEVEINTGIKDIPMCPTNLCLFYSFDKDNYKIILETIGEPNSAKINNHKVVYWEDVRDKTTSMEDPYDTWKW